MKISEVILFELLFKIKKKSPYFEFVFNKNVTWLLYS